MARALLVLLPLLAMACTSTRVTTPSAARDTRSPSLSAEQRAELDAQSEQQKTLTWSADFREAQKRYTTAVRWGLADDAAAFVDPDLRSAFRSLASRELREVRFTDYAIDALHLEPMATVATADVRYAGFWLSSPFVRWVEVSQQWHRDAETRQWFVRPDIERLRGAAVGNPSTP